MDQKNKNVRVKTIRLLVEDIGIHIYDLRLSEEFLYMTPEARAKKEK